MLLFRQSLISSKSTYLRGRGSFPAAPHPEERPPKAESDEGSHLFTRSLILSLVIHLVALGTWSLLPKAPRFSVTVGPTSMEIIVLESKPVTASITQTLEAVRHPEVLSLKSKEEVFRQDSAMKDDISRNILLKPAIEKLPQRTQQTIGFSDLHPSQGAVVEAKPLTYVNEPPRYPHLARKKGWEGTVVVKTRVEKDGLPSEIQIEQSSGHGILDESALRAVRQWKFLPAHSGALKFASWIRVPVKFELVDPERSRRADF